MANGLSTNMQNDVNGVEVINNYAGAANDKARVQLLIDTIAAPATMVHRGLLDQMSPSAQIGILKELQALYTAVS